jgi:hypothetical protein
VPIRINPPAMPKMPDKNEVATISRPSMAIISGVISISEHSLPCLERLCKAGFLPKSPEKFCLRM